MILRMNSIPTKFASWFDSCPCHECLLTSKTTRDTRARALQLEGMEESCVCMSCRGYEAVDGKLDSALDEVSVESQDELHATLDEKERDAFSEPLSTEERAGIVAEWFRGLAIIKFGFSVKFGFVKDQPWLLMGMAHPRMERARYWARRSCEVFHSIPVTGHHRKTIAFLLPGCTTRRAVDDFIATGVMADYLALQVSVFLFMPFSDRIIEREHKFLGDVSRTKNCVIKGHRFAVQSFKNIEVLFRDPWWRPRLIDAYLRTKRLRGVVSELGFSEHPVFQDVLATASGALADSRPL